MKPTHPTTALFSFGLFFACALFTFACSGDDHTHTPADTSDAGANQEQDGEDAEDADAADPDDENPEIGPPGPPILDFSPHQISFSGVEVGDGDSTLITVRNLGESPLLLSDVQINQFSRSGPSDFSFGEDFPDLPVFIDPSTFRDLELHYTPHAPGSHRGELVLFSDDPDRLRVPIRFETISATPEIDAPRRLNFGTVAPSDSSTARLEIYNRGGLPLVLQDIDVIHDPLGPQDRFSFNIIGSDDTLPITLERNHFIYLDVSFTALDDAMNEASITITSNDPGRSSTSIELLANGAAPCVRTSGDLDFGALFDGSTTTEDLTFLNCSTSQTLTLTNLEISDDAGGIFTFKEDFTLPISIAPTQTMTLQLRAAMSGLLEVVGKLHFTSNDPHNEEVELDLRARPKDLD